MVSYGEIAINDKGEVGLNPYCSGQWSRTFDCASVHLEKAKS